MNGQNGNNPNNFNNTTLGINNNGLNQMPNNMPQNQMGQTPMASNTLAQNNVTQNNMAQNMPINNMPQNNQMPNNGAVNTGLQGNVETLNPEPLQNPNVNNAPKTPVAQPIPGTNDLNSLTGNTVGTSNSYSLNSSVVNANSFVEPKKNESVGMMPPSQNNDAKKKKVMKKIIFIFIVVALIIGLAFGVYYFLSVSNKIKITPKTISIGVGDTVSDTLTDYATVNKGDPSLCSINTTDVDSSKIGTYKVIITCDKKTYESTVVVSDLTPPEVELLPVFKVVGETVDVKDFVKECTDPSNCTTKFVNDATVENYLKTAGGPYKIEIEAKDSAGNTKNYTGELYVANTKIITYLNCVSETTELSNYHATKTITDVFPVGQSTDGLAYLNIARRVYKYEFSTKEDYDNAVGNKEGTVTFDSVTGNANYDDASNTMTISSDLTQDTLNSENSNAFPTKFTDIRSLYEAKNYKWSILTYEKSAK